ncbi:FadR/GntR family transcriptional regulator [Microbacterium gilvum]|uniref:FadR/GntR family transcriptional regulator n=1 Tax=Microbacterium gilvum TaxID=1336204 RepID=A0ABP8ZZZ4_9MICO
MTDAARFGPLARTAAPVSDDIVRHLERLIVSGALAPGARIPPERALAVELGVSRTALREALTRLQSAGLVERRQGSGTRVAEDAPGSTALARGIAKHADDVAHSAELRALIEPRIAALAAQRATPPELAELRSTLAASDGERDPLRSMQLDISFHTGVARASANPLLESLTRITAAWTVEERVHSHLDGDGRRISREGHERILRALERRDAAAAESAMADHLSEIRAVIDASAPITAE